MVPYEEEPMKVNLEALESMLFIWASIADKEKIADQFFIDLANTREMKSSYDEDFNEESVRKVLSAISNRERLNEPTKKESRFWNYNMYMLEDPEVRDLMLKPIKTLNLDQFEGDDEIIFYPGQMETYKRTENELYINFFQLKSDFIDPEKITIEGKTVEEFVKEKLAE